MVFREVEAQKLPEQRALLGAVSPKEKKTLSVLKYREREREREMGARVARSPAGRWGRPRSALPGSPGRWGARGKARHGAAERDGTSLRRL